MDDFNNSYMTQTPEGSNDNPYFFEPWIATVMRRDSMD